MKRGKRKLLALLLCCCIVFATNGVVYADEETTEDAKTTTENTEMPLEEGDIEAETDLEELDGTEDNSVIEESKELLTDIPVIGVDENGNVFEIEIEKGSGVVGSVMTRTRTISPMIVNFAANASNQSVTGITEYTEYATGTSGYTYGHAGADAAYLGTENGQVKFMLSGVIGLVDASKVQVLKLSDVQSFSYYSGNGSNLLHHVSTDMSTPGTAFSVNIGPQPSYIQTGTSYYSYDGHYFYTDYEVMLSDYTSNTRSSAVNASRPYYNYFQYLPLRSTTGYSASELNNIINSNLSSTASKMYNTGSAFVDSQNTYGANALIMASVGAIESGWGTSYISQIKNNLFGLNAVDSNPYGQADTYYSVEGCISYYAETYLSKQYCNPNNYVYHGGYLGNKASGLNVSYASDPYWGEKIANIVWALDNSNGQKDQYNYTLGIKDAAAYSHTDLNVRQEASTSSTRIYGTGPYSHYAVIILGESNGFYKIQSDPVLNSSRSAIASGTGVYDASSMYAYVSKDYVSKVTEGSGTITGGTTGSTVTLPFTDVLSADWYYESVKYVYSKGLMTGLNATTFGPAQNLSRAQFAVILYRMAGEPSVTYTYKFPDVPNGQWYSDAVIWANLNGIVTGYENGYFGTVDNITREQMTTMLFRYAKYKGQDVSQKANINSYNDAALVSAFAKESMQWAVGTGIIKGNANGTLDPQGNAVRAHCATMVQRYLEN